MDLTKLCQSYIKKSKDIKKLKEKIYKGIKPFLGTLTMSDQVEYVFTEKKGIIVSVSHFRGESEEDILISIEDGKEVIKSLEE